MVLGVPVKLYLGMFSPLELSNHLTLTVLILSQNIFFIKMTVLMKGKSIFVYKEARKAILE